MQPKQGVNGSRHRASSLQPASETARWKSKGKKGRQRRTEGADSWQGGEGMLQHRGCCQLQKFWQVSPSTMEGSNTKTHGGEDCSVTRCPPGDACSLFADSPMAPSPT